MEALRAASAPDLAPTFFEFTTALAFLYFAEEQVDVAVLEVGLGGRFDATNVVEPLATAITTIGLDHEAYLGSTFEAIAFEKAGIMKPAIPVVIGRIGGPARQVIEAEASARRAPLVALDRDFRYQGRSTTDCAYLGMAHRYEHLSCPLRGRFQLDNLACALALIELVGDRELVVSEHAVRQGVRQVAWEGRLEVVGEASTILLDGAHNPAASAVLADYLAEYRQARPGIRVCLVFGMMRDKHPREFLAPLLPLVDRIILTQADLPRAISGSELHALLREYCPTAQVAATPADACVLAKRWAGPSDLICVTGSLMLVGDIKAHLRGCSLSPVRG
ncbi:MAG: bifunctional folylpolyglutamate synthase/dihydrofolate synthase [Nitrospira sp. OLB3]|nr:MAG: bifunctional folylpolyglutamate synthase/dihydrofolate synthase [Nitrospira sp. OLB3]